MEKSEKSLEKSEKSRQSNVEGHKTGPSLASAAASVGGGAVGGAARADTSGAMEIDKKPTTQYLEGLETRFAQRCEVDLCLDQKTSAQALQLFKENKPLLISSIGTIGTGTAEEAESLWSAWVLFAVKRLANGTSSNGNEKSEDNPLVGFTLSQILNANKLSLLEFFKEVPQVLAKAGPKLSATYGDDWEKRVMMKEVQADFYYLTVLFNYYRRVYQNLFSSVEESRAATSGLSSQTNGGSGPSIHMRFGWILFLVLRMRVLGRFVDLVTYINGLLAVVIILILHMPPSLRKFSFEDELFFKVRGADGNVKVIASLCALYHDASEEDVSKMVEKASNMIGDLFRKSSGFRTRSHADQLGGIDTEGLQYFEGLMDERSITPNLRIVEKDYEEAYHSRGEVDERVFINGDENVIGPLSSDGTPTSSGVKRKYDTLSSPNHGATMSTGACPSSPSSPFSSPVKSNSGVTNSRMPPLTPVSVTMSTVKWLRTYISPLAPEPSSELQKFLVACDRDIAAEVTYRAKVLFEAIFSIDEASKVRASQGTALLDSAWVEQRRLEATKLYYRVLTAMCRAESQRLANKNLTALLTNERFHRCMIACSAELVLYTHKTVTMTFPAVLEPTGITAFDLGKVIESFVRHEETLPRELKRHLNSMEQQILESMAWEKGSSMYNSLIVARPLLADVITELGLLAEPMPSLDNLTQHMLQLSGNTQRELDVAAGECSATPSSPPKAATSPVHVNGTSVHINGIGDQAANLLSPVKERPSAFSAFTSPVKSRPQPPLQTVFASPQKPGPPGGGETCADTVINVFILKVLKLAAVRTKDLCERLHQPNQVWQQVYHTMKNLVEKETTLFFNRHIDQMILCTIYGVCRVNKANVTFKKCIEHYNKQPQCKRQVFCNVLLDLSPVKSEGKARTQEVGDIIKFYNQMFVPAAKQYLVNISEPVAMPATANPRPGDDDRNDKDGSGPGSPRPSIPAVPDMSPKKVSASHNVYVSPLRSTKTDTIMSPHTRSLYACVGESTHAYQSPSKDLTAINNRLNKRLGRLDFNGTLVSDSLVAGSLYPCTRSANHHSVRLTTDSVLRGQSQPSWTMVAPLPPSPMKRPRAER
ncbi:unnamed protein product [Calypogeia fissa]